MQGYLNKIRCEILTLLIRIRDSLVAFAIKFYCEKKYISKKEIFTMVTIFNFAAEKFVVKRTTTTFAKSFL